MKSCGLYYNMTINTPSIKLRMVFLLIFIDYVACIDFPSTILEEDSRLLDFKDNEDINYIATTKKIYSGLNPQNIVSFEQEMSSNVIFNRYENSSYLVATCTKNYMLSYYLSGSPDETRIYAFSSSSVSATNDTCSTSYLLTYAYIIHTKIQGQSIELTIVKQKLYLYATNLGVWSSPSTIHTTISLNTPEKFTYISCESILVIDNENDAALVCSFINRDSRNNNIYKYVATTANYSYYPYKLNENVELFQSETLKYFRIQRINTTFIRYIFGNNTYEIYLTKEVGKYVFNIVPEASRNQYLYSFYSYKDLYYYNKEYIFHATPSDETYLNFNLYITNNISSNNLITIITNKPIEKVGGYYDIETDKFIYIYQYSNKIEYFIMDQKCLYNAWHINSDGSFNCYDDMNYCQTNEYYYHTNTRECVLSNCRSGYYRFNFECYIKSCPTNTKSSSVNNYECESNLDYCHIDQNFKTTCFNGLNNEGFQYENTKIYFDSCGDSVYFYNNKTYLYKKVCLRECPTLTYSNDTSEKCECLYNKYYLDSNKTDYYECLEENETCIENNTKYEISDPNECFDTEENCIGRDFKIFNKLCLIECPINTIIDGNYCICQYHYYINDKGLNCFEEQKSCEDIKYPVTSNTDQCFLSSIDCIEKGNKFFNQVCYINNCPENTNGKYNNGTCYCTYFYFYNAETGLYNCFGENEVCENKGYAIKCNERKQCFDSLDDCKKNELKIFNNECYLSCPDNTNEKKSDGVCNCSYYFYKSENGSYTCLSEFETCEEKGYMYKNDEIKQCFNNLYDCINNGYKKFNNECYNS